MLIFAAKVSSTLWLSSNVNHCIGCRSQLGTKDMPKKLSNKVDPARFLTSRYFKGSSCYILILGWLDAMLMVIFCCLTSCTLLLLYKSLLCIPM